MLSVLTVYIFSCNGIELFANKEGNIRMKKVNVRCQGVSKTSRMISCGGMVSNNQYCSTHKFIQIIAEISCSGLLSCWLIKVYLARLFVPYDTSSLKPEWLQLRFWKYSVPTLAALQVINSEECSVKTMKYLSRQVQLNDLPKVPTRLWRKIN